MYGTRFEAIAKEVISKKMSAKVKVDVGNGDIKYWLWIDGRWIQDFFPHAVVEISTDELERIQKSDGSLPRGYILVDIQDQKRLFAYGETALDEDMFEKRFGASRYQDGYYNILYWAAIAEALYIIKQKYGTHYKYLSMDYFASHAPHDFSYRGAIRDLLSQGGRNVSLTSAYGEVKLKSEVDVVCNDEPLGGFYRYVFTLDGEIDRRLKQAKDYLVLDGGYETLDASGIRNFEVNPRMLKSYNIGMGTILSDMSTWLRSQYPDKFYKGVNAGKVITAILDGKYPYGRSKKLPCETKAQELRTRITNAVKNVFEELGGVDSHEVLLLTGGMTLITYPLLKDIYGDDIIVRTAMPISELERIRFANLEGFCMVDEG